MVSQISIRTDGHQLWIDPALLNPDDYLIIQTLVASATEAPVCDVRMTGSSSISALIDGHNEKTGRRRRTLSFTMILLALVIGIYTFEMLTAGSHTSKTAPDPWSGLIILIFIPLLFWYEKQLDRDAYARYQTYPIEAIPEPLRASAETHRQGEQDEA